MRASGTASSANGSLWSRANSYCPAAGSISTPRGEGIAAEIHASSAGFRRGGLAEQLALPRDCGPTPMASGLATENHKPTASSSAPLSTTAQR
ncbi:hypothetical protein CgunFtcFv8_022572 [Champsocephalus gunnari]|uniref:Uncharacterized protein n=1 Tax=Champsocephalus gunnari TaxID=52237 RepID=A0AAN8DX21_CHAGU|nr:hypothetical protein CgunFtcFv8_022572 [Champsocephalus gunnari]